MGLFHLGAETQCPGSLRRIKLKVQGQWVFFGHREQAGELGLVAVGLHWKPVQVKASVHNAR